MGQQPADLLQTTWPNAKVMAPYRLIREVPHLNYGPWLRQIIETKELGSEVLGPLRMISLFQ
jgi:hypothetical protein